MTSSPTTYSPSLTALSAPSTTSLGFRTPQLCLYPSVASKYGFAPPLQYESRYSFLQMPQSLPTGPGFADGLRDDDFITDHLQDRLQSKPDRSVSPFNNISWLQNVSALPVPLRGQ